MAPGKIFKGIAASPGIAIGKAVIIDQPEDFIEEKTLRTEEEIIRDVHRFETAVEKSKEELEQIQNKLKLSGIEEEAQIFEAQKLMLEDVIASADIIQQIRSKRKNVEFIFYESLKNVIEQFSSIDNELIRERVVDLRDIKRRVLRNLTGKNVLEEASIDKHSIIIANDLTPSETAMFSKSDIMGIVTDIGGKSSHVSILARSLEIPAVVGTQVASRYINNGIVVIVDGINGKIIVQPDNAQIKEYRQQLQGFNIYEKQIGELKNLPSITRDGYAIELSANIELATEVDTVMKYGASGVGLFRTEYLFLTRSQLPTEEEQYREYSYLAKELAPNPIIIRTFDLGGDKYSTNINFPQEANPFLGWRAIRVSLSLPDIFKTQLRAILRASEKGNIKIMFPMISGYSELKQVLAIFEEAKEELRRKRIGFNEEIETGIMIEIPSAVLIADKLAKEVDFFSIGTNDLTQYTLAVDRGNQKIAHLYEGLHPAVLRLIYETINAAHKKGIWVGLCGDMASNPLAVLLLIAMGIDELSVSPLFVPEIKNIIRSIDYKRIISVPKDVFKLSTAGEIRNFVLDYFDKYSIPVNYRIWGDFFN